MFFRDLGASALRTFLKYASVTKPQHETSLINVLKTHTVRRFRADKTHSSGHSLLTQLPQGSPTTAALHLILRVLHGTQALLILGVDEARDGRGIGESDKRK